MPRTGTVKSGAKRKQEKLLPKLNKVKGDLCRMNSKIAAVEAEIGRRKERLLQLEAELIIVNKNINTAEHKVAYRRKRFQELETIGETGAVPAILKSTFNKDTKDGFCIKVTKRLKNSRKRSSSEANLCESQVLKRRGQTWICAQVLHGGSVDNKEPTLCGLFDTLCAKENSDNLIKRILSGKPKLVDSLKEEIIKCWSAAYSKSEENIKRSMHVYYAHAPTGKRKYLAMRQAMRDKYQKVNVPNLIAYETLAHHINKVDIGTVHNINPKFTTDVGNSLVPGKYRDARTYLPELAQFYLERDVERHDKLKSFPFYDDQRIDPDSFVFVMLLGGDGAPVCGTTVLVSFMNVGERLPSSNETYMLMGTDAGEDSSVMRHYMKHLMEDIEYLETNVFNIEVHGSSRKVEFRVGEIPNDMKHLHFLAGELNNNATYFTTFANVSNANHRVLNGTFGEEPGDTWKPWTYEKRVEDAAKAKAFWEAESKKGTTDETKRSNLTSFIADCKSRQVEEPLVGKLINHAKFEPLHGKNNTVKERFLICMKIACRNSSFGNTKEFSELPSNVLLVRFVSFIKKVMCCNQLGKKIKAWFNDHKGKCDNDFNYRFRGQESRAYLKHFPELCRLVLNSIDVHDDKIRILRVHMQSVFLRKLVSISVRISDITEVDIAVAKKLGAQLYRSCLLFDASISPSMWCFANVMAYHSSITFKKYGFGLGCNTMEGREQKHQKISQYQQKATWHERWDKAFRHEYVSLVYLRRNGFDRLKYTKKSVNYVPDLKKNSCLTCRGLLLNDGSCDLCNHELMEGIKKQMADPKSQMCLVNKAAEKKNSQASDEITEEVSQRNKVAKKVSSAPKVAVGKKSGKVVEKRTQALKVRKKGSAG